MKITGKVVEKENFDYAEKKDAAGKVTREAGTMYFIFFAPTRPRDEAVRVLVKAEHYALYTIEQDYAVEVFQKIDKTLIRTQATEAPIAL